MTVIAFEMVLHVPKLRDLGYGDKLIRNDAIKKSNNKIDTLV